MKAMTRSMVLGILNDAQKDALEWDPDVDVQDLESMTNEQLCDELCQYEDCRYGGELKAVIDDPTPGVKAMTRSMAIYFIVHEGEHSDPKKRTLKYWRKMSNSELYEALLVTSWHREELDAVIDG